jgi:hypothetical protein
MIPDRIKALSPYRKPCGCIKEEHDGPAHAVAEARFVSDVGVEMNCHCNACGGDYSMLLVWDEIDDEVAERASGHWLPFDAFKRYWYGGFDADERVYGEWDGELHVPEQGTMEVQDDE